MVEIRLYLDMVSWMLVVSLSNLISNVGVVASDVTGVGTARRLPAAAGYSFASA
jgi:hypothetical protein